LVNNKFASSSYNDNNTLDSLYENIANKMYIVTSYNPKNAQLAKLSSSFEKLYQLVHQGINMYVPPKSSSAVSGGSVSSSLRIPKHLYTEAKTYNTNYLHLL
jgi:hypothetical protein